MISKIITRLHVAYLRSQMRHSESLEAAYVRAIAGANNALLIHQLHGKEVREAVNARKMYQSMLSTERALQAELRAKLLTLGARI